MGTPRLDRHHSKSAASTSNAQSHCLHPSFWLSIYSKRQMVPSSSPQLLLLRPINPVDGELASVLNLIGDPQMNGKQTNTLHPEVLGYLESTLHIS